jgi:hypothetical protein
MSIMSFYVFATFASDKPNAIDESFASPHNINEKTVSPTKEATGFRYNADSRQSRRQIRIEVIN